MACMSVQTPDVGTKLARAQQISARLRVTLVLVAVRYDVAATHRSAVAASKAICSTTDCVREAAPQYLGQHDDDYDNLKGWRLHTTRSERKCSDPDL